MKKLISVFAALALVGAVAAKPAPKKPAAPAKPAVAAPAVPAPAAAAAAATKSDSGLVVSLGVYGGWNIPSGTTADLVKAAGGTNGGITGGLNFLVGSQLIRGGVGVTYLSSGKYDSAGVTYTGAFLPIEALVRLYPIAGLYIGALGGYALDMQTVSAGSVTKNNGITYGGSVGYEIAFGAVSVDVGADLRIVSVSVNSVTTTSTNIVPRLGVNFKF